MVTAVRSSDILARARKSDRTFDEMMSKVDVFAEELPVLETIERGVEAAYNIGYLSGYSASQTSVQEAIGLPVRE